MCQLMQLNTSLEDALLTAKHDRLGLKDWNGRDTAQRIVDLQADIAHAEARLRVLLDSGPDAANG